MSTLQRPTVTGIFSVYGRAECDLSPAAAPPAPKWEKWTPEQALANMIQGGTCYLLRADGQSRTTG